MVYYVSQEEYPTYAEFIGEQHGVAGYCECIEK